MDIGSDERALQIGEGRGDLLKTSVVAGATKEVHGPHCIVLSQVLEVEGLSSKGQKVPVALGQGGGKHHAVGWVRIVDGVEVRLGCGREDDAGEKVEVERWMDELLRLPHEGKGCWNSSRVLLGDLRERDVGEVACGGWEGGGGGWAGRAGFPDGSEWAVGVREQHSEEPAEVRRGWSVSSVGNLVVVEGEGGSVLELGMSSKLLQRRCQEDRVAGEEDADAMLR